jgi:electron transfer flavoprotein beta subunit
MVCLKQVPNTRDVRIDPEKHTLIREEVDSIVNPFDDYALEEALALKRSHGVKVAAMTMGPPQAEQILEYSLRRGADEAFILTDKRLAGSDTWATALAIVALIQKTGYQNVFCGQESIDSGTGHIGASLAELLNIPQVNYAKRVVGLEQDRLQVLSRFDKADALLEVRTPAVVSFLKKEQEILLAPGAKADPERIRRFSMEDLKLSPKHVGLEGSFTQVVNIDIDERFVGYVTVDGKLGADKRILFISSAGITAKKDRKVIRELTHEAVEQIAGLIR